MAFRLRQKSNLRAIFLFSVLNYNISVRKHYPLDYKIFHNNESEEVVIKKRKYPFRFPFCDVFLYKHNKSRNIFELRSEQGRRWFPSLYHDVSLHSTYGDAKRTYLHAFGSSQMRVALNAREVLTREVGMNWWTIGISPNYNHHTNKQGEKTKFLLTPALLVPALPFA